VISFEHVFKRYPERGEALSDLSFEMEAGEMAFLTGHSGAGKSTLLRLIGLLERPSAGRSSSTDAISPPCRDARSPITVARSA
jgi:cell division transport system ATP-binding protein